MRTALRIIALGAVVAGSGCDAFNRYRERSEEMTAKKKEADARAEIEKDGGEYRVGGTDFSVAVPADYVKSTNKAVLASAGPGGLVIQVKERPNADWFLASIAIVSAGAGTPPPASAQECTLTGEQLAEMNKAKLVRAELIDIGATKTCQWETNDLEDTRHTAVGTVMQSPSGLWAVTCNHDGRDTDAKTACSEVLASWKNTGA